MKSNIQVVEKKQIKYLSFPKEDVLSNKNEKINRFVKLHRILYSSDSDSKKVEIVFSDGINLKKIETSICGVTDTSVILKKSTIIPLARIVSVA